MSSPLKVIRKGWKKDKPRAAEYHSDDASALPPARSSHSHKHDVAFEDAQRTAVVTSKHSFTASLLDSLHLPTPRKSGPAAPAQSSSSGYPLPRRPASSSNDLTVPGPSSPRRLQVPGASSPRRHKKKKDRARTNSTSYDGVSDPAARLAFGLLNLKERFPDLCVEVLEGVLTFHQGDLEYTIEYFENHGWKDYIRTPGQAQRLRTTEDNGILARRGKKKNRPRSRLVTSASNVPNGPISAALTSWTVSTPEETGSDARVIDEDSVFNINTNATQNSAGIGAIMSQQQQHAQELGFARSFDALDVGTGGWRGCLTPTISLSSIDGTSTDDGRGSTDFSDSTYTPQRRGSDATAPIAIQGSGGGGGGGGGSTCGFLDFFDEEELILQKCHELTR
eukprot:TRINITY_DN300_c2_g2_i1.p1 TRINITY_DN300_c2_g2~~TRINITY_DN300_c2_g2_i1.p1  ORF type:complete len:446 (+),score=100.75 TRINITY_DN300_c2_g2_i1:161-1339(+)